MSGTHQFFPPVGISQFRYPCIRINIGVGILPGRFQPFVYSRVVQTFVNHFAALIPVQCRTEVDSCIRKTSAGTQSNFSTSYCSFLGSNQNHSIGSTRTIKRSGGSIFYHCDILNISRIKRTHHIGFGIVHIGSVGTRTGSHTTGSNRYAINDKKRFIGCIERTHTTDTDTLVGSRLAGSGSDVHPRCHTLQLLFNREYRHVFQHIGPKRVGRSGKG